MQAVSGRVIISAYAGMPSSDSCMQAISGQCLCWYAVVRFLHAVSGDVIVSACADMLIFGKRSLIVSVLITFFKLPCSSLAYYAHSSIVGHSA